jgi:hypothetical protein
MRIQSFLHGGVVLAVLGTVACSGESGSSDPQSGEGVSNRAVAPSTPGASPSPGDAAGPSGGDSSEESELGGGDDDAAGDDGFAGDEPSAGDIDLGGSTSAAPTATTATGTPLPSADPVDGAPEVIISDEGGSGAEAPPSEEDIAEPDPSPVPPIVEAPPPTQAGLLTAGVWDDNRNFERFMAFRSPMFQSQLSGLLGFDVDAHEEANDKFKDLGGAKLTLDIALVVDTTGSMGDEIQYLQTEVASISMRIEKTYPDAEQHWALVVYKDVGDEYVAQAFDFGADLDAFRDNLDDHYASGGGDFPEAPDAALAAMNELSWRGGEDTARLAFWVADAPHHVERAGDMTDAIAGAQELGVHIYPVASSGIDEFTELAMRSTAQLTGGRYMFLTDDSGIGGSHKEPTIPCYFVTRLDVAMLRMVEIEMSGEYHLPAEEEIVRTGGDPEDGACQLESGEAVFVF